MNFDGFQKRDNYFVFSASDAEIKPNNEMSSYIGTVSNDEQNLRNDNSKEFKVFNFCKLLPRLEESGKIRENKESRKLCTKLINMLTPMFKKKSEDLANPATVDEGRNFLNKRNKIRRSFYFV